VCLERVKRVERETHKRANRETPKTLSTTSLDSATYCNTLQHTVVCLERVKPHEKLHGIRRASNLATRKDLASRTWGVFWY